MVQKKYPAFNSLYPDQQFKILLVKNGNVKIADIYIECTSFFINNEEMPPKYPHELELTLLKEIKSLGLTAKFFEAKKLIAGRIIVARNEHDIDEFRKISVQEDKARGEYLGIPNTAIEAFITGQSLSESEIPLEIKNSPYYELLYFRLSKLHFKAEWKTFLSYIKSIKEFSK